jgi:diguanylate cyclase (GGDEF)-like protein
MNLAARRTRLLVPALLLLCVAWLVVNELRIVLFDGRSLGFLSSRWAHEVVLLTTSVSCLARAAVRREQRTGWLLVGLGMLAWSMGELYYTAALWNATGAPIPSPGDACYLLFAPLCLAGLVALQRGQRPGSSSLSWADGLATALSIGALSAALLFRQVEVSDSGSPLSFAITLAYPLMDMILLAAVFGAIARRGWRPDRVWLLLGAGLFMNWLADTLYLVATATGTYQEGSWFDTGWWGGFFLVALAAWQSEDLDPEGEVEPATRQIAIPFASGVVGLGVLVYGAAARTTWLTIGLSAASVVGVMIRLLLMFRENVALLRRTRAETLIDPLTGLGNRRALSRTLERAFAGGDIREHLLILFDLDGFKGYNDRFGHVAGDALLTRVAARLQATLPLGADASRLGGDEFCALIPHPPEQTDGLLAALSGALSDAGPGYTVTCSYGVLVIPGDAGTPTDALRTVDERMYAHKLARRGASGREAHASASGPAVLAQSQPAASAVAARVELAPGHERRLSMG